MFRVIIKTKDDYFLVQFSQMFIIEAHYISYEVHYDSLCIMRNEFGLPSVLNLIFMVVLSTLKSLVGSVCL